MQKNNSCFGWILQENPNFWEDNGYKKINSLNFHIFHLNLKKKLNHLLEKHQTSLNNGLTSFSSIS